jgi:nucleoside-diphosphate-sugar epimerase
LRRILITGGAGFVGRHFARYFLENGDEVHAVDSIQPHTGGIDPTNGWPLFEPRDYRHFKFYKEDCRDYFERAERCAFDYALHLAALVGGRMMIENDPLAIAEDLSIDAAYWRWARKARPKKTVTFSSSAAYPIHLQQADGYVLLQEDMIDFGREIGMPDMSYGWAKLTCEYLGRLAFDRYGLQSVAFRPFSGYGEDQDDTYPFPSICKRALRNRSSHKLRVWGSGNQMRDFIHIDDCVRGVVTTMDKIDNGDAINLSTGVLTSFIEFARTAAECCGYSPLVTGMEDRPSGVYARGGDTNKQKTLGFTHTIELRSGVERAIDYYLSA